MFVVVVVGVVVFVVVVGDAGGVLPAAGPRSGFFLRYSDERRMRGG